MTETVNDDNIKTLIGVVSGGAGCGDGVPGWYSKVSYHIDWIRCIIDKSGEFNNNQQQVMEACMDTIKPDPTCVKEKELVIALEYFHNIKNKTLHLCNDFDTFGIFDR